MGGLSCEGRDHLLKKCPSVSIFLLTLQYWTLLSLQLARTALIRSAYVDDIASGGGSVEEVETISRDIDSILACGGFSAKPLHRTGQDGETSILGMSWDKGEDSVTHHSKSWRSVSPPHSRVGRSGGLYKHSTIRWACWRPWLSG